MQGDDVTAGDRLREHQMALLATYWQHTASRLEELRASTESQPDTSPAVAAIDVLEHELTNARSELAELGAQLKQVRSDYDLARAQLARAERDTNRAHDRSEALQTAARRQSAEAGRDSEAIRAALNSQQRRVRELEQVSSVLTSTLQVAREHFLRVEASSAWRWGHRMSRMASRLALRRTRTQGAVQAGLEAVEHGLEMLGPVQSPRRELDPPPTELAPSSAGAKVEESEPDAPIAHRELADEIRRRLGPPHKPEVTPPRVSCIVLNRNGRHHLETLFAGLEAHTDYPDLEVVLVDNASTDDSVPWVRSRNNAFKLRLLESDRNMSFSEANNRALDLATGKLLLFLNNDVVLFESGWLWEMVACLGAKTAAVGATLLHPRPESGEQWVVQHRGIRFGFRDGYLKGVNSGDGTPLLDSAFGQHAVLPAVTAACLLMSKTDFESVGGFAQEYRYGTEDVELGLRLIERGRQSVCSGRAIVIHNENSTQQVEGREFMRVNRTHNRQVFLSRWSSRLRRTVRVARLEGDTRWSEEPPHIAITVTSSDEHDGWGDWQTAHELGDALEILGWRVAYLERKGDRWYSLPPDLDYLVVLLDAFDVRRIGPSVVTVAWIRNWTERWTQRAWFDRFDVLLASSRGSVEVIEELTGRRAELFPLATNPERFSPRSAAPAFASDYVFTGSYFGRPRQVQAAIDPRPDERFLLFGKSWEKSGDFGRWSQGQIPYSTLPDVYASTKLVVDDSGEHALPYGAVNSRVFDALAVGALPLSNGISGIRALFGEDLPVWDSRETLRAQIDALLADEQRRNELVNRYRGEVLSKHTYAHRAHRLREILLESERSTSFCIKIGAPNWEVAQHWGDLHFARAVARELNRRGHRCHIQVLDEWDSEVGLGFDVVLHLRGLSRYTPKPGQFNVMWQISHPEDVSPAELGRYDLVLVASERHAAHLATTISVPTVPLEQATDPRVFFPDPDDSVARELVFVGNSRKVRRTILEDLLPTDRDIAIWGRDWSGLVDPSLVAAEFVPNEQVRTIYSSAGLVLCDHWPDMRRHGFVSNRIYDALACGAVVVSDHVPGVERFDGAVVTYRDRDELTRIISELLDDPVARSSRGDRGREIVLSEHTFAHRVDELLRVVSRHMDAGGHRLAID